MAETFELRNPGGKEAVNVVLQTPSVLSFVNVETGESFSTYLTETAPISPIADLTENEGAIGGTNDGNLPSLTIAALTENGGAIGGTNDGNLPDLTTPTAALACEAVREVAAKSNAVAALAGPADPGRRAGGRGALARPRPRRDAAHPLVAPCARMPPSARPRRRALFL